MNDNLIAKILFIIGVAQIAAGFIIGLIAVTANYYVEVWPVFLAWAVGGFITGMLFIGFAENIRLLHSINERSREKESRPKQFQAQKESKTEVVQSDGDLSDDVTTSIYDMYQNETIAEIVPYPYKDYCLVRLKSGDDYYVRVVHIGDSGVQETADDDIRRSVIQWYNEKS